MKKLSTIVHCVLIVAAAVAAPTANEDFVIAEDAQTFTNAVNAAKAYADGATNAAVVAANRYTDAKVDEVVEHSATTKVVRLYSGGGSRFISGDGSVYSQRAEERWHVEFMGETYDLEPNFGLSPNYWEGRIDGRMGYLAYEWEYAGCWSLNIGMGNDFTTEGVASDSSVTFTIGTFEIRCTRYSEGIGFNYETRLAYTNDLDFSQSNATLVATIRAVESDPTVPGWAKSDVPPQTMTTNDVCNIVTNVAKDWSCELGELVKSLSGEYWTGRLYNHDGVNSCKCVLEYNGSNWRLDDDGEGDIIHFHVSGREDDTRLVFEFAADSAAADCLGTNKIVLVREGILSDLARHRDIDDIRAEIGSFAGAVESVNSKTGAVVLAAADVGAYSAADGVTLAGQVATIGAHLNAEDARFVVTNYNSVTHTPEAYVEIVLPDTSWSRIWSEMTRWNYLFDYFLPTNYYDKSAVDAALAGKADRAWGFYDSTTGAYAPDGYTWISSEKIAIAANLAYQRTITTEGSIWVLESNGTVTESGGLTNGFFRISDDEGNSLFEIVKGNKRTVGADASSCQIVGGFTPTKMQIGYSIVSDVHPTIYVCESLTTQNWKAETDSDCIANVSWSGSSGAYVAQVQGKVAYSSMFVKATYEVGGETYISNAAPVSMQYIMIGGVKYSVGTATISGNTVLTLTVAQ